MSSLVIFQTKDKTYRIVQHEDLDCSLEDLKGDCFEPEPEWVRLNATVLIEQRKNEEQAFEQRATHEGVFGYVLEKWNATPGIGYEEIESCWGFVGPYSEGGDHEHYVVTEMKSYIEANI